MLESIYHYNSYMSLDDCNRKFRKIAIFKKICEHTPKLYYSLWMVRAGMSHWLVINMVFGWYLKIPKCWWRSRIAMEEEKSVRARSAAPCSPPIALLLLLPLLHRPGVCSNKIVGYFTSFWLGLMEWLAPNDLKSLVITSNFTKNISRIVLFAVGKYCLWVS